MNDEMEWMNALHFKTIELNKAGMYQMGQLKIILSFYFVSNKSSQGFYYFQRINKKKGFKKFSL